jgi:alpha 1,6-mannosyltransferase
MAWQPEKWMTATQRARVDAGEALDDVLGPPSVIVGIEADVGEDREDWHDWYPRPLQVVQWTLASAPFHPIALQAVLRAAYATTDAAEWSRNHYKTTQRLRAELAAARAGNYASDEERAYIISSKQAELSAAEKKTALSEPRDGGPVGVMGWTGPGVWTDAVLAYLHVRAGAVWTDLRELRAPTRFADVLVLPVTGFSPGVGQFGAAEQTDGLAMVWHQFRGSWREDGGHPMLWHGP